MNQDLLFEIGVEELPSSFIAGALAALPALAKKRLGELRVAHGEIRALRARIGDLMGQPDDLTQAHTEDSV